VKLRNTLTDLIQDINVLQKNVSFGHDKTLSHVRGESGLKFA